MRIWRYWFFWKYTVSHVIQYTLCCVGVFWMPITQKTDLFNLLWLYNSNIITSIYITSPTKQGVSSHYWWSRSIPGDSSRDLLIPQFEVPSNLQKGHLTIPKRSQRIARYIYIYIYIYIMFFALNLEVSKLTKKTELPAIRSQLMSLCFNRLFHLKVVRYFDVISSRWCFPNIVFGLFLPKKWERFRRLYDLYGFIMIFRQQKPILFMSSSIFTRKTIYCKEYKQNHVNIWDGIQNSIKIGSNTPGSYLRKSLKALGFLMFFFRIGPPANDKKVPSVEKETPSTSPT